MFFISQFLNSIRMFMMGVFGPLQSLAFGVRSFMVNNPLAQGKRMFQAMGHQAKYFLQLPRHYAKMILPKGMGSSFKGIKGIKGLDKLGLGGASFEGAPGAEKDKDDDRGKRVRAGLQRAEFSQIHIVERETGVHHVLHIGTVVGQSATDIKLDNVTHGLVRLRFSQIDPKEHNNAPMMLTYLVGTSALEINGKVIHGNIPLQNFTTISLGGMDYQVEFYAYDLLPTVTRVDAAWKTTVGVRDVNEDAIGLYQHKDGYMFVIADGVGGGYAGDEVSAFATQYLLKVFENNIKSKINWTDTLRTAYTYINTEVRRFFINSPHPTGSTLTAVVIKNWQAHIAHVGDTVIYLYRHWGIEQITTDHSEQIQVGYVTDDPIEALEQPATRNMLLKAIGKADQINPDVFSFQLQPNDALVLCSDGLSGVVDQTQILDVLENYAIEQVPKRLIELAGEHESKDNISVIVVHVLEVPYERDIWTVQREDRVFVNGWLPAVPRLKKPREMLTIYSFVTSWGCFVLLALLFLGAAAFGISQSQQSAAQAENGVLTAEATVTARATTGGNQTTTADETEAVEPTATLTRTPSPTPIGPTATLRLLLPMTATPVPPRPTLAPTRPTSIATTRPTLIPTVQSLVPTSTLRSPRN